LSTERDIAEVGVSYTAGWFGAALMADAMGAHWAHDPSVMQALQAGVDPGRLVTDLAYLRDILICAYVCCDPRVAMTVSAVLVALATLLTIHLGPALAATYHRRTHPTGPR
jgi:hypothetical protein